MVLSTPGAPRSGDPGAFATDAPACVAAHAFAGKGEMPTLIRETDWSTTPLGPVESWPQSLRTAVSICLGSHHPIVLWWGPERWMFYNDGYRPLLGDKHPQFVGRPGRECWAEIWDIIGPMMDHVIATGEARSSEELLLPMRRHGYLEERYYTFSYSPIRDETGKPSGILGISPRRAFDDDYRGFFDLVAGHVATAVSNARAYEEEPYLEMARVRRMAADVASELAETRATLLEDIERKNHELEALSYSVSHDLRAPLRSIDGFSLALLEDHAAQLDADGRDCLKRVRDATQRMELLIEDLLELSRVERADLRREPVDVSRLGRRIGEALAKSEPDRKVELVVQGNLVADADARLLEIVLENLLGNAWKFTKKRSSSQIELGSVARDGQTIFYVKDNGAGFDEAYAGRLFSPFQRLHSEREFPGTGIGLATVQRVVDRHGGRVWAEGKVDRGATVSFTLPSPKRSVLPEMPPR